MRFGPKVLLPTIVLAAGLLGTTALVTVRPAAEPRRPEPQVPGVRVVAARPGSVRLHVRAHGTVRPRTETDLVAESAGRIVWVSPQLEVGAFFQRGDPLLRVDRADYENAAERVRAGVTRAESELSLARATLRRRRSLRSAGAASRAASEEAESRARIAQANLREARALLQQAELDLQRTQIQAPFDGRVRSRQVDIGHYLGRGARVARIDAVDWAEVDLPIPDADLAFLDLPGAFGGPPPAEPKPAPEPGSQSVPEPATGPPHPAMELGPRVTLHGRVAGREQQWPARIVRTAGALEPRTRMLTVVARVEDPYAQGPRAGQSPLPMGLFVSAEIEGRLFEGVTELPRAALGAGGELLLVDSSSRLQRRPVEVLRREGERVWVRSGLRAGERVSITPLATATPGMPVRVVASEPTAAPEGPSAPAAAPPLPSASLAEGAP